MDQLWVGVGLGGAALLLLLIVILRVVRTPARYPDYPAPYILRPTFDPRSRQALRQSWQATAHSDLLPLLQPGGHAARKLLTGIEGQKYVDWRVESIRLVPYDARGRLLRFAVLAPDDVLDRYDHAIRSVPRMTPDRAERLLRRAARRLARKYVRQLRDSGAAALPIAFDIALKGAVDKVLVQFELYRAEANEYRLMDRWEPELIDTDTLHDQLTYTLGGRGQLEPLPSYRQRLEDTIVGIWQVALQPLALELPSDALDGIDESLLEPLPDDLHTSLTPAVPAR
jgi:hypothetical protein